MLVTMLTNKIVDLVFMVLAAFLIERVTKRRKNG